LRLSFFLSLQKSQVQHQKYIFFEGGRFFPANLDGKSCNSVSLGNTTKTKRSTRKKANKAKTRTQYTASTAKVLIFGAQCCRHTLQWQHMQYYINKTREYVPCCANQPSKPTNVKASIFTTWPTPKQPNATKHHTQKHSGEPH